MTDSYIAVSPSHLRTLIDKTMRTIEEVRLEKWAAALQRATEKREKSWFRWLLGPMTEKKLGEHYYENWSRDPRLYRCVAYSRCKELLKMHRIAETEEDFILLASEDAEMLTW